MTLLLAAHMGSDNDHGPEHHKTGYHFNHRADSGVNTVT